MSYQQNQHVTGRVGALQSTLADPKFHKSASQFFQTLFRDFQDQVGVVEAAAYATVFMLLVVGYHMLSDGVFSSVITLASVIQFLGLVLALVKVEKIKNFGIMSMHSLQLYVPVYVFRLGANFSGEGYLPLDSSGDWCYQAADFLSLVVVVWLLVRSSRDPTVKTESYFPVGWLTAGCFVLACIIFPRHNLGTWPDTFWAAALYLETFVMFPQLLLVTQEMSIESLTSHTIACTAFSRCLNFYFWIVCRQELIRVRHPSPLPQFFVLGALALQVIILADFMFYYVRAAMQRTALTLPCFDSVV